jgi:hypothetical protein
MLRIAAFSLALLLVGCGQGQGQSYVYIRADGQDPGADPALYKQLETDSMICQSQAHQGGGPTIGRGDHAGAGSTAVNDCMATKGYLVVQSDSADLKREELAAKATGSPEVAAHAVAREKLKSSNGGTAALRTAPVPDDGQPVLEKCTRISDKAARLLCFDRAAAKGSDSRR